MTGDVRDVLAFIPDNTFQCCVTSPPYYGLRDYGVDGQIGHEPTPQEFVKTLVDVFREVRRVLRPDGVCFLNIGDSYSITHIGRRDVGTGNPTSKLGPKKDGIPGGTQIPASGNIKIPGMKPKNLCLVPERLAIALQEDGWYVRSRICWAKPNPMPESTKDRPTSSWEHIWMLTKSERYFWDQEAAKEPSVSTAGAGNKHRSLAGGGTRPDAKPGALAGSVPWQPTGSRNMRNVWNITTKPCRDAHFAVFPPEIPETAIKAATSERGCCPKCGTPWVRIVEKGELDLAHQLAYGSAGDGSYDGQALKDYESAGAQNASDVKRRILEGMRAKATVGWEPTCQCGPHDPVPCWVLDPFGGSGTTGMVAQRLGRKALLIELNPDYVPIIRKRLAEGK